MQTGTQSKLGSLSSISSSSSLSSTSSISIAAAAAAAGLGLGFVLSGALFAVLGNKKVTSRNSCCDDSSDGDENNGDMKKNTTKNSTRRTSSSVREQTNQMVKDCSDGDYLKLTYAKLEDDDLLHLAVDESCGAIATFVGTTRNTFQGKLVTKLSYEAYAPMALKQMKKICLEMRKKWSGEMKKIVILHRLGACPVGEASVMIAVSSPHRKEALNAVHWAIDQLKKTVPIWKKEHYTGNNNGDQFTLEQ